MCCLRVFCRFVSHKTRVTSVVGTATDARVFRPPRTPPAPTVGHNYCARLSTGVMLLLLLFYTRKSTVEREKNIYTNTRLCGFLGPRPGRAGRRIRLICLGRLIPGRKTEWNGERPGGTETRVIGRN